MRFTSSTEKRRQSARKQADRRASAEMVRRRWERNGNRCECCNRVASVIEVAHLVGKGGHIIADRWASTPELCVALCCARTWGDELGCHERLDRNLEPYLLSSMRTVAAERFALRYDVEFPTGLESLDTIRELVRQVEAREDDDATA